MEAVLIGAAATAFLFASRWGFGFVGLPTPILDSRSGQGGGHSICGMRRERLSRCCPRVFAREWRCHREGCQGSRGSISGETPTKIWWALFCYAVQGRNHVWIGEWSRLACQRKRKLELLGMQW